MLQIIDYSDKAVAVIGDTKNYVEQLRECGGRFNSRLSCGAGWIFSKRVLDKLQSLVNGDSVPAAPKKEENPLKGMRVYVGTYGSYNSGSLFGAWLNLDEYKNKDEFYAACRELHKRETDPEFMFQDYEGVPSWMIGESWIDPELWNMKPEKEPAGLQSNAEKTAIFERVLRKGADIDYYVKSRAAVIEVSGRAFDIDKPTIGTDFCHADEPEEAVRAWYKVVRTFDYFRDENMEQIDKRIAELKKADFIFQENNGLWRFGYNKERYYLQSTTPTADMDEKTRTALLNGYERVKNSFEKRLSQWWKRYGAEKLHVWTYWADR